MDGSVCCIGYAAQAFNGARERLASCRMVKLSLCGGQVSCRHGAWPDYSGLWHMTLLYFCVCCRGAQVAFDKCHFRVRHFAGVFTFPYKTTWARCCIASLLYLYLADIGSSPQASCLRVAGFEARARAHFCSFDSRSCGCLVIEEASAGALAARSNLSSSHAYAYM